MKTWRIQWDNGSKRSQIHNAGALDEIVIGGDGKGPCLLHIEHMGGNVWDVHVGNLHLSAAVKGGKVSVVPFEVPEEWPTVVSRMGRTKHARAKEKKKGAKR